MCSQFGWFCLQTGVGRPNRYRAQRRQSSSSSHLSSPHLSSNPILIHPFACCFGIPRKKWRKKGESLALSLISPSSLLFLFRQATFPCLNGNKSSPVRQWHVSGQWSCGTLLVLMSHFPLCLLCLLTPHPRLYLPLSHPTIRKRTRQANRLLVSGGWSLSLSSSLLLSHSFLSLLCISEWQVSGEAVGMGELETGWRRVGGDFWNNVASFMAKMVIQASLFLPACPCACLALPLCPHSNPPLFFLRLPCL